MRRLHLAIAASVIAVYGCKTPAPVADAGPLVDAGAREDPFESYRLAADVPAIAFAAVTRDRIVLDGATGAGASAETVFEAASIAKTVIAVSVMQLVEERKLDLDADVTPLVGFPVRHPTKATPITLRMLLAHTSTIHDRDDDLNAGADVPLGDFLRRYLVKNGRPREESYVLATNPGETWRYSNVASALAAYAVERASGTSFDEQSTRRIFAPLGMTKTSWRGAAIAPHRRDGDGGFVALAQPSHAVYPVIDLRSSARDLARYARALLQGGALDGARIVTQHSIDEMIALQAGLRYQGLGWQIRTYGGRVVAGHEGEDAGASTAMFLDFAAGTGAIVLANGDAFSSGVATRARALEDMLRDLLARAVTSSAPPVPSAK